jgi:hypothetical protein
MNRIKFVKKDFIHVKQNIGKILFDMYDKIFVDVEEYFAMCPWMNDFDG